MDDFDLIVIGVGPAGEKAAAQAAYFGKRVVAIERAAEMGGAGTQTGTLPSKTLRETAMYLSGYRSREMYGVAVELEPSATLEGLMSRKATIVASESQRIRDNLARHGVTCLQGVASFVDAHTVEIAGKDGTKRAKGGAILIATGSRPARHPISTCRRPDPRQRRILTSSTCRVDHDPRRRRDRLRIRGMFAGLRVKVTLSRPRATRCSPSSIARWSTSLRARCGEWASTCGSASAGPA
jgi:pyruvate/2-oxoglutarate dehydrogenase complex dihydrolipoamide dehydrogenase (E3) component